MDNTNSKNKIILDNIIELNKLSNEMLSLFYSEKIDAISSLASKSSILSTQISKINSKDADIKLDGDGKFNGVDLKNKWVKHIKEVFNYTDDDLKALIEVEKNDRKRREKANQYQKESSYFTKSELELIKKYNIK